MVLPVLSLKNHKNRHAVQINIFFESKVVIFNFSKISISGVFYGVLLGVNK